MDRAFAVFVFLMFICVSEGATGVGRNASEIRKELINRMDIHVRPEQSTTINISFVLTSLNKLKTVSQELSTTFHLHMTWTDPRLVWEPKPGEPESLVFYVNELWTPPLVVSNAIEDAIVLLKDDIVPMRVSQKGRVTWIPRITPTTTCDIDISKFPVDSQICHIHITSWIHSISELDFLESPMGRYREPANLDLSNNGIWKIVAVTVESQNITESMDTVYKNMQYTLYFQRNERFYWILIMIPFFCVAFLMSLVFLVPSQYQGDKVAYSITLLLSFQMYLILLQNLVPPAIYEGNPHILGEYVAAVMIYGTLITAILFIQQFLLYFIADKITKKINKKRECLMNVTLFVIFLLFYFGALIAFHSVLEI